MAPPFVAHIAILGGFTKPRESRISETRPTYAQSCSKLLKRQISRFLVSDAGVVIYV